jgi:cob(I)alamin adenosyltransferase
MPTPHPVFKLTKVIVPLIAVVLTGKYSLVVLDELSLAIHFGLIPLSEVLIFLEKRPTYVDIIFTGPQMPQAILDVADQITEIRQSQPFLDVGFTTLD